MANDKTIDPGQRCTIRRSVNRAHQQPRHEKGFVTKMALHAIGSALEPRPRLRLLRQRIKNWSAAWVHRSQVNDRATGNPADRNVVREINAARSLRVGLVVL